MKACKPASVKGKRAQGLFESRAGQDVFSSGSSMVLLRSRASPPGGALA